MGRAVTYAIVFFAGMAAGFILGMTAVARQWRRYCDFWREAAFQARRELDATGKEHDQQDDQDQEDQSSADIHVSRCPGSRRQRAARRQAGQ